jgi:hypothetical protein
MPTHPGVFLVPLSAAGLDAARGGRTYATIAQAVGCSPSFFFQLCQGSQRRVSPALAASMEDALGVSRGTLFGFAAEDEALLRPYCSKASSC